MELIDPKEIRFVWAPIAPMLIGDSVHYEQVAFKQDVDWIRRIEAEPVKHAHWIIVAPQDANEKPDFRCSACYCTSPIRGYTRYCPHCGAMMLRGEQDDESRSNSNAQTDTRARGMGATDKSSGI